MWSIQFITTGLLLLLVMQWSIAMNLNLASKIASRQLTIKESFPHLATSSSHVENDCFICLDHVNLNKSASPNYPSSNGSFRCGHGIKIHQTCSEDYLAKFTGRSNAVQCSLCRRPLQLNDEQLALVGTQAQPIEFVEDVVLPSEIIAAMEERWPGIQEMGHAITTCFEGRVMYVMACAQLVLAENIEDVVSPMLTRYLKDSKQFVELQMWNFAPLLHRVKNFRVYNDANGNVITIHEAYHYSIKFRNGEPYRRKLQHIATVLSNISEGDISQQILRFPELVNFEYAMLRENENIMGTINQALCLLCVRSPSLNTAMLKTTLEKVNYEFFIKKDSVDYFLEIKFPYLVEFKSMGNFDIPQNTIENYARLIMHSGVILEDELNILSQCNAGAKSIKRYVDEYIQQKYGHCNIKHFIMENTPGRDITLYTAIKFTLNPNLYMHIKGKWIQAINNQLSFYGCTPKDVPPIHSMRYRFPKLYRRAAILKQVISGSFILHAV